MHPRLLTLLLCCACAPTVDAPTDHKETSGSPGPSPGDTEGIRPAALQAAMRA